MNFINKLLLTVKQICEKNALSAKIYHICEKNAELIRYIFCGGLTTLFNLVIYLISSKFIFSSLISGNTEVSIPLFEGESLVALLSNAVAWALAVAFAFFVNKIFVFRDDTSGRSIIWRILEFYLFRVITGVAEIFLPSLLIVAISMNDVVAKIIVSILIILGNYFFTKFVTFNKNRKSQKAPIDDKI